MKLFPFILLFSFVFTFKAFAQVENVPVSNPVYKFLMRYEAKGYLPAFSTSSLPLQRKQIADALEKIQNKYDKLSSNEQRTLDGYLKEFQITERENTAVFPDSGTEQIFFDHLFDGSEKFIYYYRDSSHSVSFSPLASADMIIEKIDDHSDHVLMGNLGFRLYGTLDQMVGYYLQVTNGAVLNGNREIALIDNKISQNVKFVELGSDFDFSESHVNFQKDWFYFSIGRQTRLLGAGLFQRVFFSDNAPPMDAFDISARFEHFDYRFTHGSLIAIYPDTLTTGWAAGIPSKYVAQHRFALRPDWGEIAFWESVIYSKRGFDLAYLNPLSFFKSLEHALHDRDNAMMGLDATIRPIDGLQFKGSFLLDDIKFGEIGTGYWANKWAWNASLEFALSGGIDLGLEYSRVEPYTFSHFDTLNAMTNDEMLFGGYIPPNADETALLLRWWWGDRYPLELKFAYRRHGENVYDENGELIKNVGGDPLQTRLNTDPYYVEFLDGNRVNFLMMQLHAGWEIARGYNLHFLYRLQNRNSVNTSFLRIIFAFGDFNIL